MAGPTFKAIFCFWWTYQFFFLMSSPACYLGTRCMHTWFPPLLRAGLVQLLLIFYPHLFSLLPQSPSLDPSLYFGYGHMTLFFWPLNRRFPRCCSFSYLATLLFFWYSNVTKVTPGGRTWRSGSVFRCIPAIAAVWFLWSVHKRHCIPNTEQSQYEVSSDRAAFLTGLLTRDSGLEQSKISSFASEIL